MDPNVAPPSSWLQIGQTVLSLASPVVLYFVQRARAEQSLWREEVRKDQQAIREEVAEVKEISQDVQVKLAVIEEKTHAHERDIAGLRERWWPKR